MDTGLKLATDYAMEYKSPEQSQLPKWAVWKDKAYGTTYEPVVFIYNKRLIPAGDVPDSRRAGEADCQPDGQIQEQSHHLRHRKIGSGLYALGSGSQRRSELL
jgi:hypothetical protein